LREEDLIPMQQKNLITFYTHKVPNLNKVFRKFEESSGYAYFILNANFSSDLYNHSENVINICPEEGKLFATELKLMNSYENSIEIMSIVEPHKSLQNSFTIVKKVTDYNIYSISA